MDPYGQVKESKYNPFNRFFFCFCHSYEVDKGWGFGCLGCRAFSFSCGVWVFSLLMVIVAGKDTFDITNSDYFKDAQIVKGFFKYSFIVKMVGDGICILAIICALLSTLKRVYVLSIIAYYLGFLSFILSTIFCIYAIMKCFNVSFWTTVGIFTIIFWGIAEFILLLFDWILFCNMVDIKRKNDEDAKNNSPYGF